VLRILTLKKIVKLCISEQLHALNYSYGTKNRVNIPAQYRKFTMQYLLKVAA
jgi:hypothetical protein